MAGTAELKGPATNSTAERTGLMPDAIPSRKGTEAATPEQPGGVRRWTLPLSARQACLFTVAAVWAAQLLFQFALIPRLRAAGFGYLEDKDWYIDIARNVAEGKGYALDPGPHPTLRRMPAYPLFLAGLLTATGGNETAAAFLQTLLAPLAAGLCFLALRRSGPLPAAAAGLAVGLHPLTLIYSGRFFSECLSVTATAATLYFAARFLESGRYAHYAAVCATLALACLTRTSASLWALPTLALLAFSPPLRRRPLRWASGVLLAAALVAPWPLRNALVSGTPALGTTWNGRSLLHGVRAMDSPFFASAPRAADDAAQAFTEVESRRRFGPVDTPAKELAEERWASEAHRREFLGRLPSRLLALPVNAARAMYLTSSAPVRWAAGLADLALLALGLAGLLLGWRKGCLDGLDLFAWLFLAACWAAAAVFFPLVRYLAPAAPAMAVLAARGLARLLPAQSE